MPADVHSLGAVTPAEWAELHALETTLGGRSLIEFVHRITPQWVEPWHLSRVAELFSRAEYGPVRAVISLPPRHGKTEILLHAIAWWLSRHPASPVMYCAAEADLAIAKSKRARDLAISAGLPLRQDTHAGKEWQLDTGGGLKAAGVGGSIVGRGAELLIIDDPIASREQAESPAYRARVWEWFEGTVMHRLEPGGSCIVVHTRWSEDDLIGRICREKPGEWEVINLPALGELMESGEIVPTDDGKALWPWRWPVAELLKKRAEVGEYNWWALYQGRPSPKGGGIFKRRWWRFYKTGMGTRRPDGCTDEPAVDLPKDLHWRIISVDASFKATLVGSRVAALVVAGERGANRYVLDNRTGPLDFRGTCDLIRALKRSHPKAFRILIEDKANGPAIINTLHSEIGGIVPVNPQGGKESRAAATQPSVESGNWYLPEGADWLDDFVTELALFPSGTHDDQVDALTQVEIYMVKGLDVVRAQMLGVW